MTERDPRDTKDIRPFTIERGLTRDPAWVIRLDIGGNRPVVLRASSFEECVEAISPFFFPERRLLGELETVRGTIERLTLALRAAAKEAR